MKIPISFKVGKRTIKVEKMVQRTIRSARGTFRRSVDLIHIAHERRGQARPGYEISEIFWHEAVHAILHDMGHPLWGHERFVTAFSKRLNQLVHTAKLEK